MKRLTITVSIGIVLCCITSSNATDVLSVTNAISSSHGTTNEKNPHYPAQAIDQDLFTCWSSQPLAQSNEWIQVELATPSRVSDIRIVNGWRPKGFSNWYTANHRAKDITILCDNGVSQTFLLKDTHSPQTLPIDSKKLINSIRITIDSVYTNQDGGDQPSITITEIALLKQKANSGVAQTNLANASATDTNIIAVVLGKKIPANERDQLRGLIFRALLQQYAKENQIEPTDEELDVFVRRSEEQEKKHQAKFEQDRERLKKQLISASLSDRDRKNKEAHLASIESILKSTREMKERTKGMEETMRPMKHQVAQQFVMAWKINKALYEQYGGRVIFQQAGVEPLDAYRDFLKEQEKKGAFQIIDKQYEPEFWRYFTNDAMHTFYKKDDGARFINTPWWMTEEPPEE